MGLMGENFLGETSLDSCLVITSRAAAESNGGVSAFKTFSDFSLMGDF